MNAYFLDLDGTLADSRPGLYPSFRSALREIEVPERTDAELLPFLGTPLPEMFRILRPDISESQIEHGMNAFRATYESVGIEQNHLYPGVPGMLGAIAARGDVAWVVTSKPERYAIQVAALLGLDRQVTGVIGAGLDESDTKTSLIARALVESRAERRRAVMVGDRHYDVVGAIENGIRPIGVLWGYGSFDELHRAGCRDFAQTVDDFRERYVESQASARGNPGIRRSSVTQA